MIIIDELPFSYVENDGFRNLMWVTEPKFVVPSRSTITRDCLKLYLKERTKLKEVLTKNEQQVCLTTDTWTSCQNMIYMCLTAHFIDDSWRLHKRILNYSLIPDHRGETCGKAIEQCLHMWGISKVFTISVDNAK